MPVTTLKMCHSGQSPIMFSNIVKLFEILHSRLHFTSYDPF